MTTINVYAGKILKKFDDPEYFNYDINNKIMTIIGKENRDDLVKLHVITCVTYYNVYPPTINEDVTPINDVSAVISPKKEDDVETVNETVKEIHTVAPKTKSTRK